MSSDAPQRILIVEDEESLADSVRYNLEREGYAVTVAADGRRALERFRDGVAVARDLGPDASRGIGSRRLPIDPCGIRRADHHGHGEGLGSRQGDGARARCRRLRDEAVLGAGARLAGPCAPAPHPDARGRVTGGRRGRRAGRDGRRPARGPGVAARRSPSLRRSSSCSRCSSAAKGRLLTRDFLIEQVWGVDYFGDTKTLDVHVKRLRKKIETDPHHPVHLMTVRGLGYKFVD